MTIFLCGAGVGVVWIGLLFGLCFLLVHLIKLVKLGWEHRAPTPPPKPTEKEEQKAPAKTSQEPVYYIVEKKRRAKTSFGEPKQIRFK